jgi:hypothetical protein
VSKLLFCMLVGCSAPPAGGQAQITLDDGQVIELPASSASVDGQQRLVLTWMISPDASALGAPFFQIAGVTLVEGTHDPGLTEVAFYWPGSHDRPFLHPCGDCRGTIRTQLDQISQTARIDLDLMVPFTDERGCPGGCYWEVYSNDLGTFVVPDRLCDGGTACLDWITCPGEPSGPVQVYPDDAGSFDIPIHECPYTGLKTSFAHVVAGATLTRDSVTPP